MNTEEIIDTCICGKCDKPELTKAQIKCFDLLRYIYAHPTERFWQAARNYFDVPFIYFGWYDGKTNEDTFFIED